MRGQADRSVKPLRSIAAPARRMRRTAIAAYRVVPRSRPHRAHAV
jgi:hypothetical protein